MVKVRHNDQEQPGIAAWHSSMPCLWVPAPTEAWRWDSRSGVAGPTFSHLQRQIILSISKFLLSLLQRRSNLDATQSSYGLGSLTFTTDEHTQLCPSQTIFFLRFKLTLKNMVRPPTCTSGSFRLECWNTR